MLEKSEPEVVVDLEKGSDYGSAQVFFEKIDIAHLSYWADEHIES
jgi:hypothetical protein